MQIFICFYKFLRSVNESRFNECFLMSTAIALHCEHAAVTHASFHNFFAMFLLFSFH